jgi:hypothetical protein
VLARIRHYGAALGGRYWQPAGLLEQLARSGGSFSAWSADPPAAGRGEARS